MAGESPGPTSAIRQWSKDVRAFIIRHDTFFTMLGAFIVFLGFFVREGVLEKTKDLDSALDQATFVHEFREEFARIYKQVSHDENAIEVEKTADADVLAGDASLFYGRKLLEYLPNSNEALEKTAQELKDRSLAIFVAEFHIEQKKATLKVNEDDKAMLAQTRSDLANRLKSYVSDSASYKSDAQAFDKAVTEEAEKQHKENKQLLNVATTTQYLLFLLGWGFGLAGKILKIPSLGGASES